MDVISALDALLWLFSMFLTVYMCYYAIFLPFSLARRRTWAEHAPKCRFAVLVSYAVSTLMAAAVTLLERKPVLPMLRGVLSYWGFLISWLPINTCCLVHRTTEWKAIAHTRGMGLSQMK